eukprot:2349235-Karenia_brevis.AAC.1
MPPHVAKNIGALHKGTWFSIEGVCDVAKTAAGAQAGVALADLVFSLLMYKVISRVRRQLELADLIFKFPDVADEAVEIFGGNVQELADAARAADASFVDDAVFPVVGDSKHIESKTSTALSIILRVFSEHVLVLNFMKGKSEIVFSFAGRGSQDARRKIFHENGSRVCFKGLRGEDVSIGVVDIYKHLGTHFCIGETLLPEVKYRCGNMMAVVPSIAKSFLHDPQISLNKKSHVVQAVLFSRGFYNAGAWPVLRQAEMSKMHACTMKVYRSAFADPYLPK